MVGGTLTLAAVQLAGRELMLALVDRSAIADPKQANAILQMIQKMMPGKNVVLAAEDKMTVGKPTIFYGPALLTNGLQGHSAGDFKWTQVKYT